MPKLRASSGLIEKTSTKDLNVISGDTSATSTTVADADRVLLNDNGTMVQVAVTDLAAYFDDEITAMPNLVTTGATTVGALNSGSITSGFGTIDTGSSTITTTGLISGGSLDIDNVLIDGTTIGHTDDTDLITVADGLVTVAGELQTTTLDIGGTNITSTAAELNIMDGGTSATSTTVADADRVVMNDNGTMVQVAVTDLAAYFDDEITAMPNLTSVGTLTTLTVDNIIINGTNIGHTSDTDAIAIASNGNVTLSQNLSITGDLTVSGTTTTVDSTVMTVVDPIIHLQTATGGGALGSDTNKDVGLAMQYHNGSAAKTAFLGYDDSAGKLTFIPDASISSEVVSGTVGSIVANLEGNVTGNINGDLTGTLQTAAQGNVTSLGTLTALTVDNVAINGTTIGHTSDTDLLTLADGIVTVAGELQATTLDIGGTNITTTAAEINLIDGGTARGTTAVASGDGILINDDGTMRMTNVDTVSTYFASHSVGGSNIVTTGALNSGSITSGFGTIDTGSSTITTTGLISGGSLDIDDVLINGTTIGHTDDTDLMTLADGVLTIAGELDATTLDISGNADIDGTTNLDAVDIDGAVQIDATVTVGVDDTGHDVKFFGATSGAYMLWDESADDLILAGAGGLVVPDEKLTLGSTAVTSTAAELNIMDGGTSATSTTLADADRIVVNDVPKIALDGTDGTSSNANDDVLLETGFKLLAETGSGTMKQVTLGDLKTFHDNTHNLTISTPTAVAGSNAYTVSHESADSVIVYRNGVQLDSSEVTTNSSNNTVTFTCVDTSDKIAIHVISALSVSGMTVYRPTAVAGSNAYSVVNDTNDTVLVYRNGVLLDDGDLTISTSNDTVTFTCTDTSDEITIQVFGNITSVTERQAVVKHTPTAVAGSNAYSISNASGDLVQVFRNGVLLGAADVTVNASANTVTFTCSDTSDLIEIYVMGSVTVGTASALGTLTTDVKTPTNKKVIQQGAFMQSSTHQALTLGY
tara:strand:+ start:6617 stop:9577 length:2961 start_codon:yes stop_codon:yes gene_type:complete